MSTATASRHRAAAGRGQLPGAGRSGSAPAGADVALAVDGDTGRLPATTGLAVYRVLQEALTNAVKHAPGAPTAAPLTVDARRGAARRGQRGRARRRLRRRRW